MATKKEMAAQAAEQAEAPAVTEKTAEQVEAEAKAAARRPLKVAEDNDPAMEMQEVLIPVNPAEPKDTDVVVGLNGKLWRIKRGVSVKVPKAVVEIIQNSQKQQASAMQLITSLATD